MIECLSLKQAKGIEKGPKFDSQKKNFYTLKLKCAFIVSNGLLNITYHLEIKVQLKKYGFNIFGYISKTFLISSSLTIKNAIKQLKNII